MRNKYDEIRKAVRTMSDTQCKCTVDNCSERTDVYRIPITCSAKCLIGLLLFNSPYAADTIIIPFIDVKTDTKIGYRTYPRAQTLKVVDLRCATGLHISWVSVLHCSGQKDPLLMG